jgi:cytochrome P450
MSPMNMHTASLEDTESGPRIAPAVPVVRGLPGIGVAWQLHRHTLDYFADTAKRYGDRVELRVLGQRVLLLTSPADVEAVLTRHPGDFGRSTDDALRPVFGDGVYLSEGDSWRAQRRVVLPAFHHDRVVQYASVMVTRMIARADAWRDGQTVDVLKEMSAYTSDVMCEVLFGQEQSPAAQAIANAVSAVFENLRAEVLYLGLWRKLPLRRSRRWNRAVETLHAAINMIIAERRSARAERDDLLHLLLTATDEQGQAMPDAYAHDEVMTMFVAGQETSSVALSWAIAALAQHPELQREAATEVAAVTNGRDVTLDDYPRLRFLTAVVQETLRLYPPIWVIARAVLRDTVVNDLPVRAGTKLWMPVQQIHRNARWFSEPDRFNPHRWSDAARRPKGYFPFGVGPRGCLAQHFAMTELVLGLAAMLARFEFRVAPGAKIEVDAWLTLRPKHGVPVVLSAR